MLSIPLPFLAGLIFVLVMQHSLKGVDVPGSRRYFFAFLAVYVLQELIVGLHLGYGVKALAPVQPVTATIMPPLAYLAFFGLTGAPVRRPWLHALVPAAVLLAVLFLPASVDLLLLVIFLSYGVALWRLAGSGGDDVMVEARLERMRPAMRAARLTAGTLVFFAFTDAILAVYTLFAGADDVPLVVGVMSIALIATLIVYWYAPQFSPSPSLASEAGETMQQSSAQQQAEDDAAMASIVAALDGGRLYRDENLSLAKLARKAGLPARTVSAAINRVSGLNVSQFVNNRRIDEACRLLIETDRSATSLMFDVGFSTKSNFNREFRRVTGMSPRQWRASGQKRQETGDNGLDLRSARKQLGNVQRG